MPTSMLRKKVQGLLSMPEMRIFWLLVPFLVAVFVLNFFYLPPFLVIVSGGLLVVIALAVFLAALHLARGSEEARVEQNELRSIMSNLEDALVAYDQNFTVIFFNPTAENLFKLRQAEVVGHQLKPQDVEEPSWRLLAQTIFPSLAPQMAVRSGAGTYPQIIDVSFADPLLELRTVTSPIDDGRGTMMGFMKIIQNRTREVSLLKSKNEFLTVASHQLRSPVTALMWGLESLSRKPTLDEEGKTLVAQALASAKELLSLIEDLLNITKIEEGHFGYQFEPKDLVEFVNTLLAEVVPQARRAGIKVYFNQPKEPLPPVTIDPQKLSLALTNILDNAVRYNVKNGEVAVSIARVPNQPFVSVNIEDTGIGIPPDDLKKLFTKFFRAENAMKSQTEGSGLGLYIAKNIIQAHGGTMTVQSELNRGTTFSLALPTDPSLVPQHEAMMEEYA